MKNKAYNFLIIINKSIPKGDDGGRAENSKQRDKKLSLKVAYTPNEHDEYALAFSTQKGTKESPFYSGADSFERYWRWPMWDKDSIYFLSHTEFGAHQSHVEHESILRHL